MNKCKRVYLLKKPQREKVFLKIETNLGRLTINEPYNLRDKWFMTPLGSFKELMPVKSLGY